MKTKEIQSDPRWKKTKDELNSYAHNETNRKACRNLFKQFELFLENEDFLKANYPGKIAGYVGNQLVVVDTTDEYLRLAGNNRDEGYLARIPEMETELG